MTPFGQTFDGISDTTMMKEPFEELLALWGAWFPDADLEGLSDPEVVRQYLGTITAAKRIKVRAQCDEILSQEPLPSF